MSRTAAYSYDENGRLKQVVFSNGAQVTYNYDEMGNRTSVVEMASWPTELGTIFYGDGENIAGLPPGTEGQVLTTNGDSEPPSWADSPFSSFANSDHTSVVNLTKDSPSVQGANTAGGTVNYVLPLASSCPGKLFLFHQRFPSGWGTANISRSGSDTICRHAIESYTSTTIGAQMNVLFLQSDGVDKWRDIFDYRWGMNLSNSTGLIAPDVFMNTEVNHGTTTINPWTNMVVYVNTAAGSATLNLPRVAAALRKVFLFKNKGPNNVTLVPDTSITSDTVGDESSYVLGPSDTVMLQAQGTNNNWQVFQFASKKAVNWNGVESETSAFTAGHNTSYACDGTFNITIPAPADGASIEIINEGTGTLTLVGQTISGQSSGTITLSTQWESIRLRASGSAWYRLD